jgi:hypothetical protein
MVKCRSKLQEYIARQKDHSGDVVFLKKKDLIKRHFSNDIPFFVLNSSRFVKTNA